MSLVGKELVGKEVTFAEGTSETDDVSSNGRSEEGEVHRPVSPQSGAESLFFGNNLRTSNISANALASELRRKNSYTTSSRGSMRSGSSTVATDDFCSAYDNLDDLIKFSNDFSTTYAAPSTIYEEENITNNMSSTTNTSSNTSPNVDAVKVDAAEHIYEGAKNVWGWGKDQMIISTFLGITEAVAGKVVSVVGTDLEEIDNNIKPQLTNFDSNILNPAVQAVLGVIMNAAGKSENFVKPIVVSILKPIGLIKDNSKTANNIAPELTNTGRTTSAN